MKKAIVKGMKVGANAGFLAAAVYALFVLVMAEILLPISAPSEIVIISDESSGSLMQRLLSTSPIWLILPVLLGAMTSAILSFVLMKYIPKKRTFSLISISICFFLSSPAFFYGLLSTTSNELHIFLTGIAMVAVFLIPSIIYILTGFLISQLLYNQLDSFHNIRPSTTL